MLKNFAIPAEMRRMSHAQTSNVGDRTNVFTQRKAKLEKERDDSLKAIRRGEQHAPEGSL
jgi:hypothetical protein